MQICPTCQESTEKGIRFRDGATECMFCEALRDDLRDSFLNNLDDLVRKLARQPRPSRKVFRVFVGDRDAVAKRAIEYAEREGRLDPGSVVGPLRLKTTSFWRQMVMAYLRDAGFGLCEIGAYLKRDHSTVLYGVDQIRRRERRDDLFRNEFTRMKETLNGVQA